MARFIFFLAGTLAFLCNCSAGEGEFPVSGIPKTLLNNANAVVRLDEQRFEIVNAGKFLEKNRYVVTILNEKGEHWAEYEEYYSDSRKINNIEGFLYDAAGKQIGKMKTKDAMDLSAVEGGTMISDARVKQFSFAHRVYPYTVDFTTEIESKSTLFFPSWYAQPGELLSVEKSSIIVTAPLDYVFRYKAFNYPGEPVRETRTREKVTTWKVENLPAYKREPYGPQIHEFTTLVIFGPTAFRVEDYSGNMSSWKEFGKFVYALKKDRDILPDEVKQKVHQLSDHLPDIPSKISSLYHYLQKNTRYISIQLGIGGWQPFDAKYVASKAYGDCKALTNYMYGLLKEAGIKSFYTLVRAGAFDNYLNTDFPSQQFNHVILCVPLQKDTIWLECTSQSMPAGYIGDFTNDRPALLINEEGGELVMTKRYPAADNRQERKINAVLGEDASLLVNSVTSFSGLQMDDVHGLINNNSKDRIKKHLEHKLDLATYDIVNFAYNENNGADPVVREELEIRATNYASFTGKRLFIIPNIMNRGGIKLTNNEERKYDVILKQGYLDIDSVTIEVPAGYLPESIPAAMNLSSPFGDYTSSVKVEGTRIRYFRRIHIRGGRFPASAYPELVKFYEQIHKADRAKLVLVKAQ